MDYDFSRLNSRSFEQLVQALSVKIIAPGVVMFGDGPDGGREAAYRGEVPYPSSKEPWHGTLVVQAKYRQRSEGTQRDTEWALRELEQELKKTFKKGSKRIAPSHYIFATNVTLSSVPGVGGKARVKEVAQEYGLEGFRLWDGDQIRSFLDGNEDIRNAYLGFTCPGDVLAELQAILKASKPNFDSVLANFLAKELLSDQYANLEQAGRVAEEQIPISRVFVDLPVRSRASEEETPFNFLSHVVNLATERLDPESQASRGQGLDLEHPSQQRGRLVLVGGPGQGKTTLGQFLCQLFRVELLKDRPPVSLPAEVLSAIAMTNDQCRGQHIPRPTVRRFPVRIPLTELSDWLAERNGVGSLLAYLTERVARRTGSTLSVEVFEEWLGAYPWLLVLDGLDEVPASSNRLAVMKLIRDFWVDVTQANADILVLATTRPQGYNDDFSPRAYEHLSLEPLSPDRALHYGQRLAVARHPTDDDKQVKLLGLLKRATQTSAVANLMTTPLQVTIMATLVDQGGQPPRERWNLFSRYYEVIYQRELEKELASSDILRDHRPTIDVIHHQVALLLQVESERASHAEAKISSTRFGAIVRKRMEAEGYEGEDLAELEREVKEAAANRLVFLVGLEADAVGFEIRSLQEFMAAKALMASEDAVAVDRLRAIAGITSWRNVFLFAAGECFATRQYLRDNVTTICRQLNDEIEDPIARVNLPGSILAADLLADGFARNQPAHARLLAEEALSLADRPGMAVRLTSAYQESLRENYEKRSRAVLESSTDEGGIALLLRLSSNGHDWADVMLDSHTADRRLDLATLLRLGKGVTEGWLARHIRSRIDQWGIADYYENHPQLVRLNLGLPPDASALLDYFEDGWMDERISVPLAGMSVDHFSLSLQSADSSVSDLAAVLGASEGHLSQRALAAIRAIALFSRETTAAELAEQLELVADAVPSGEWGAMAQISPWPMSMPLALANTPEELRNLAELAREGALGDRTQWTAAEVRWQRDGVTIADLGHAPALSAPFDREIAERGFPHGPVGWSVRLGLQAEAERFLLEAVDRATNSTAKSRLAEWLGWLIGASLGVTDPITAEQFGKALAGLSPKYLRNPLTLLHRLSWRSLRSPVEDELLDKIGQSLRLESPGPNWDGDRLNSLPGELRIDESDFENSAGTYVLFAVCAPLGTPTPKIADVVNREAPGAGLLLWLKGDWQEAGQGDAISQLVELAREEPIWLRQAFRVMEAGGPDPRAVDALVQAWDELRAAAADARVLGLRADAELLGSQWINERSSELDEPSRWKRLGFFDPPREGLPTDDPF
jgi:hypothetical protein